ncbi:GHKL domain-containing protein [Vibrio panuliri]|uniref:GHKL domain-containing protein n=1 Tax=Vibrio panuliri TaxID=1381081 RepID=UPI000AB99E27|nr:sensor histidine kinase [Vibrio panuliri]KAB1458139.1 sensor histidine kinase [Vibrio panuliri]
MQFPAFSFTKQIALLLSSVLVLCIAGWWSYSAHQLESVLTNQIQLRAQVQSQQLSQLPSLVQAVANGDKAAVKEIITTVQVGSDADFITVSDAQGIRLAHPVAQRIGLPVMGGDIERALTKGESYLSYGIGSLGPSVRYISPILANDGRVLGMIKVGYLTDTLAVWSSEHLLPLLVIALCALSISFALAVWFSNYVKTKMQHLEPWQLKQALETHQGVLQATYEGVIAVNTQQNIYLANHNAQEMLGITIQGECALHECIDQPQVFTLEGEDFINRLIRVNERDFVLNRVTLVGRSGNQHGAVFSLRAHQELQTLSERLSQIDRYIEHMRITRHEYQNKLSTISGLLQAGEVTKALDVCLAQAKVSQDQIDSLQCLTNLPLLSGLILAKIGQASEKRVPLKFNCDADLSQLARTISEEQLCSLLGNLIDNATESVTTSQTPYIHVWIKQSQSEYIFVVANNGPMINSSLNTLCQLGFTSKNHSADHGLGLYIVRSIIESVDGHMEMDSDEIETAFTVYLPKESLC